MTLRTLEMVYFVVASLFLYVLIIQAIPFGLRTHILAGIQAHFYIPSSVDQEPKAT